MLQLESNRCNAEHGCFLAAACPLHTQLNTTFVRTKLGHEPACGVCLRFFAFSSQGPSGHQGGEVSLETWQLTWVPLHSSPFAVQSQMCLECSTPLTRGWSAKSSSPFSYPSSLKIYYFLVYEFLLLNKLIRNEAFFIAMPYPRAYLYRNSDFYH